MFLAQLDLIAIASRQFSLIMSIFALYSTIWWSEMKWEKQIFIPRKGSVVAYEIYKEATFDM